LDRVTVNLSGERFHVLYSLSGDEDTARFKAHDICLEQTVEFPADLVPPGDIAEQIVGRIERFERLDIDRFQAWISFAVETSGFELLQLLNVIFGNISIKPGIRVERIELPERLLGHFKGPRFGVRGLRESLGVYDRPLLCTALKPMGCSPQKLAEFAYQFALGGIDIIKDDHGLTDQPFSPFRERVERCAEAVSRANRETGRRCIYMPNITTPHDRIVENARWARGAGAGGLLVCPALTGMDGMRALADDDEVGLPLMAHPAFQGSYVTSPTQGLSHYVLYGQLTRLAGADASIYPNYGGRFSFSRVECAEIAAGCSTIMGGIRPIFPTPGGGMSLDRLSDMHELYGLDVIYLIGGNLHRQGKDLVEGSRMFLEMVSAG
jgi:ribulose-bisphosphate carboxylase large chain